MVAVGIKSYLESPGSFQSSYSRYVRQALPDGRGNVAGDLVAGKTLRLRVNAIMSPAREIIRVQC